MWIENLRLVNYRNYEDIIVNFEKGLNALIGENGSGKTNAVEAIAYMALMRSFRGNEESSLIRFKAPYAIIEAKVRNDRFTKEIRIVLNSEGKLITLDQNNIKKLSDFSGEVRVVSFIPEDVALFRDSPKERRQLIDQTIASLDKVYLQALTTFRNLIKNRNALLKESDYDEMMIEVITKQMIEPQYIVETKRVKFIEDINGIIQSIYNSLSGEEHQVELVHKGLLEKFDSYEMFKKELNARYKRDTETDMKRKVTSTGIHKDDVIMLLDGCEIASYGSQGQNRLAILALKIALARIVKIKSGEDPILIFDDVMSELDRKRRENLANLLNEMEQVFITSVKMEIKNGALYDVALDKITRRI